MASDMRQWRVPAGLVLLAVLACVLAPARADDGDPPGRLARLSDVEGAVSLEPAGLQEWTAAPVNRPLTTGDRLWTDQSSRAELDLGDAAVRLGSRTGLAFLNLDENIAQMQLTAGSLIVRIRDMWANQHYEIDTPNVAVTLQQPGEYRVDVSDAGDATVAKVIDGAAQVTGGGQTIAIGAQQQVTFSGTSTLTYQSATLGPPDDLDGWSAARERAFEDSSSTEYVADDVPGTQDLDNNGQWQQTPEYGYVWMPTTVVMGWVPYRYGRWAWVSPWGWTWIDDARWGYAPFHYGRWVQWRNTWCWLPGPRQSRPVYAPAQVAWVGGPGASPSPLGANVGWFPLGPHEAYVPAYRASPAYLRNVNISNATNVNTAAPTHYANNRPAAVTSVPQSIFVSGQRVGGNATQLSPSVLAGSLVTAAAPAIVPTRQSALAGTAGRTALRPPAAQLHRITVVRTMPPPAPVPFDRQLAAVQDNGGRPLTRNELAPLQPAAPAVPVKMTVAGPLVNASALPQAGGTTSFAQRQHALEHTTLPPGPHSTVVPPAASLPTYAPPRTERPPQEQAYMPPVQQQAFAPDDPTHAYSRPPSLPVYHPPAGPDPGLPNESVRTDGGHLASHVTSAPPPPAHPPPPPAHPPPASTHPPPPRTSSSEPRDSAPHGDRDSRERGVR
jgi:FecR protein